MHQMRLLKAGFGDKVVCEWSPDRQDLIEVAEREFGTLRSRGNLIFRLISPGVQEVVTEFNKDHETLLVVPPIIGG